MQTEMVIPRMIERTCGRWLAVSPRSCSLKIGVTAPTEADAREDFRIAFTQWREMLSRDTRPAMQSEIMNA